MKRFVSALAISALAIGLDGVRDQEDGPAAASAKWTRRSTRSSKSVEENQERTRTNEGRIGEVDQKALAADQRAAGG